MRCVHLAMLIALTGGVSLLAQPPAPAPATDKRLDELLTAWEKRMSGMESFATKATRTELEKLTGKKNVYIGRTLFTRPNFAQLVMVNEKDNTSWEKYVSNGVSLYEYQPKNKIVRVHELPKQGLGDNTALAFLFGMKVSEAKKRYELTLVKEDEWYAYVGITPRFDADKQEFRRAQLVLYMKPARFEMLPCRLWFEAPNGDEATWVFEQPAANIQIPKEEYVFSGSPKGWTLQRAAAPTPPPVNPTSNTKDKDLPPIKARP